MNFDPNHVPHIKEILGEPTSTRDTQRKDLKTLKSNIGHLDDLLDVASRQLFLTDRHENSAQYFEQLASQAPAIRRLVERAESAVTDGRARGREAVINEANAWAKRVERVRTEVEADLAHDGARCRGDRRRAVRPGKPRREGR
ncbi:hypothetical protein ADK43_09050 [Streptomyces rimosus subsp. rimosus]|nr:hypothetical protein ADK43_09050 [Streptomyces rimosus subsp. rimosus]